MVMRLIMIISLLALTACSTIHTPAATESRVADIGREIMGAMANKMQEGFTQNLNVSYAIAAYYKANDRAPANFGSLFSFIHKTTLPYDVSNITELLIADVDAEIWYRFKQDNSSTRDEIIKSEIDDYTIKNYNKVIALFEEGHALIINMTSRFGEIFEKSESSKFGNFFDRLF